MQKIKTYKVIVDCEFGSSAKSFGADGFVTVKFVRGGEEYAKRQAILLTKKMMLDKGYEKKDIDSFKFSIEQVSEVDEEKSDLEVEKAFIYY